MTSRATCRGGGFNENARGVQGPESPSISQPDVVITTLNRPESVLRLCEELRQCRPAPSRIIVVDSSDQAHQSLRHRGQICYLRARHKNQPYQRYVGLLASNSDAVVLLDDDLFVRDFGFLGTLAETLERDRIVGAGVAFAHATLGIPDLFPAPRSPARRFLVRVRDGLRTDIQPGRLGPTGRAGGLPSTDAEVEFLPGAVMGYRREVALQLFDERLFALFEARLGMGEDKAISMRARRFGRLYWHARVCLEHPPLLPSTYSDEQSRFLTKVLVSRYFLAQVYAETQGCSLTFAERHFLLELGRMLGSGVLRGRLVFAVHAVAKALQIVLNTRLRPEALTPGVNFWEDASADASMGP